MTPAPGDALSVPPAEIAVRFDDAIDPATVTNDTFSLQRSGGDGTFDDGNEIAVPGQIVASADGRSIAYRLPADTLVSRGGIGGAPADVVVVGNLAYVADGAGLKVVDVSKLTSPVIVGAWESPEISKGVAVSGSFAYVADGDGGLRIIDVSDPIHPREVGHVDTPGYAVNLTVAGGYAYIADGRAGLRIVDVGDPVNPIEVGYLDTPDTATDVTVVGNYAYVTDEDTGLLVIDAGDPAHPVQVGAFRAPDGAVGVAVSDSYAYVSDQGRGMRVVDVSDPANPQQVGFYGSPGSLHAVTLSGARAYLADGYGGLRVIDVSDPANPRELGGYTPPGPTAQFHGVDLAGNFAFVADRIHKEGEIQGVKWNDRNGDGLQNNGEPRLAGWVIYIDKNENGQLDDDEPFDVTASDGSYAIAGLSPGTWNVTELPRIDWEPTHPAAGVHRIDLPPGDPLIDVDFGNRSRYLTVDALVPTRSGFAVQFSRPFDPTHLNLFDVASGEFGPADVILAGDAVGPVSGSLVVGADSLTWIATGGILPPDRYTVTLRSAPNGLQTSGGQQLDGNADGTPGDDYGGSFTLDAAPHVVLTMPDFTRGPGQEVKVPAVAPGLPIGLSDAAAVHTVELTIEFDPELLVVTGVAPGLNVPADAQVAVDTSVPGRIDLSYTSGESLPAGFAEIFSLVAQVPTTALYGTAGVLTVTSLSINGGTVSATADDAIHCAAYVGDTTGNQTYSGLDAQRVARVAVGLDEGFAAYPTIDPLVIADVTGSRDLSSLDAQRIAQVTVGLDPWEIPPLPGTVANLPPQVVDQVFAVEENVGAGQQIGVVEAHDPDQSPQPLTFALTGDGADDLLFSIDSHTGVLAFRDSPDFENPSDEGGLPWDNTYEVEVQVSDGDLTDAQIIGVSVLPLNDNRPQILSEEFPEVGITLFVGYVLAEDDDLPAQDLEYSITGNGEDDEMFEVGPDTGELML